MSDRYGYIAIETILDYCENTKDHSITPNEIMRLKREPMPKKGKWIEIDFRDGTMYGFHQCSVCGARYHCTFDTPPDWNYCPNCGARMECEEDERLNQQTGGD